MILCLRINCWKLSNKEASAKFFENPIANKYMEHFNTFLINLFSFFDHDQIYIFFEY